LASRIDRLLPETDLIQTLAVIGKEFKLGLIERIALKPDPQLQRKLDELQASEFIYKQPAAGDTTGLPKASILLISKRPRRCSTI
jgi:predicted ATPase